MLWLSNFAKNYGLHAGKIVRAIISGMAAEIVPKFRGPKNNSRA